MTQTPPLTDQALVEKLRERAEYNLGTCDCDLCQFSPCVRCENAAVFAEAAAKIERLTHIVERAAKVADDSGLVNCAIAIRNLTKEQQS